MGKLGLCVNGKFYLGQEDSIGHEMLKIAPMGIKVAVIIKNFPIITAICETCDLNHGLGAAC